MQAKTKYALSGTAAGLVNGLFGGGGGMVLVPLLNGWCGLAGKQAFATCVAAILPLSAVSAAVYLLRQPFDWAAALPYLIGGLVGGLVGGRLFRRVSVTWLRGLLAALVVLGGGGVFRGLVGGFQWVGGVGPGAWAAGPCCCW